MKNLTTQKGEEDMFLIDLLLLPILLFLFFSILILPFQFAFYSLINIITIPGQLIKIAINKKLRQNHALEHSTINVLEREFGYRKLAGYATEQGFFIQGKVHPAHLENAAIIGLQRLQRGENHLAIHNRCGTSMLAANFVAAVIFIVLLWQTGMFNFFNIIVAIILSQFVGPLAGRILQRFITTSAQVKDMDIIGVEYNSRNFIGIFGMSFPQTPNKIFCQDTKK